MSLVLVESYLFNSDSVKDVEFSCSCGWFGSELELDIISNFDANLVCCPVCQNLDVRISFDK